MPEETNPTAASLSALATALSGAVAAAALPATIAGAVTSLLGITASLLSAHAAGGVSSEQWAAVHTDTANVLAEINARRANG